MAVTTWKLHALLVAALGACLVAGCQEEGVATTDPIPPVRLETILLRNVAEELGVRVVYRSRTSATLRNPANTVVLYADPEGQAFVNGAAVPDSGGIEAAEGTLLIPAPLAARIRPLLRPIEVPLPDNEPEVREPSELPKAGCIGRVVIDPGHGGRDPGAISCLGFYEKDIVLTVSRLVADELRENDVEVRLTRTTDRFIELEGRPAVANRCKADLFVSIHADAAESRSAHGFTVYVSPTADADSLAAASAIAQRMRGAGVHSRGVRRNGYRVLVHSQRPAVLVELGYLSHRWEAARLNNRTHQRRLARAVAQGICGYLTRE